MTKDEIIQMAREADKHATRQTSDSYDWTEIRDERFAALVAEKEREACAALCDEVDKESQSQWPKRLSTMIRARGNK